MGRNEIDLLIVESGLDAAAFAAVADALCRIDVPAEVPVPSPALAAALRGDLPRRPHRRAALALATGMTLTLAAGGTAAANLLPDPVQQFLHDVTEGGTPLEFPEPDRDPTDRAPMVPEEERRVLRPLTPDTTSPDVRSGEPDPERSRPAGEPGTTTLPEPERTGDGPTSSGDLPGDRTRSDDGSAPGAGPGDTPSDAPTPLPTTAPAPTPSEVSGQPSASGRAWSSAGDGDTPRNLVSVSVDL